MTIKKCAFMYCINLKTVNIEYGVEYIYDEAFESCYELNNVFIPDSVVILGEKAFSNCMKLSNIKLSNNLTYIGTESFRNCSLENIVIPSSVNELGSNLFYGNKYFRYIYYCGNENDWNEIKIQQFDNYFKSLIYFYSEEKPISYGKYWYYDSFDNIVIWK
jgi:hypothetical protein